MGYKTSHLLFARQRLSRATIMGASGWDYFVPYEADISVALRRLQDDVFARGDYVSGVGIARSELEKAFKGLGSDLESKLREFTAKASDLSLPAHTREKFAILAKQLNCPESSAPTPKPRNIRELLEQQAENGTHSILDIVRISPTPEFGAISPFPRSKLSVFFESEKPTRAKIEAIYEGGSLEEYVCERWQGVYIIAYRDGSPDEIFFAGCSGD